METPEYIEGPEARENFERGMIALFKVPKPQPDLGVIPFSRRPVNDFYRYLNCTALLSVNLPGFLNNREGSLGELVPLGEIAARVLELVEAAGLIFHRAEILAPGGVPL